LAKTYGHQTAVSRALAKLHVYVKFINVPKSRYSLNLHLVYYSHWIVSEVLLLKDSDLTGLIQKRLKLAFLCLAINDQIFWVEPIDVVVAPKSIIILNLFRAVV
jgi:hypothetical protein